MFFPQILLSEGCGHLVCCWWGCVVSVQRWPRTSSWQGCGRSPCWTTTRCPLRTRGRSSWSLLALWGAIGPRHRWRGHRTSTPWWMSRLTPRTSRANLKLSSPNSMLEKTKVAKANSPAVEDGPGAKRAKLDAAETTMVKKRIHFCPLKDALNPDWSSEQAQAALKRTSPDFFLLQVLLQFRTDAGRDPQPQHYTEDCARLLSIRGGQPGAGALPDTFVGYCFSEMAAVCAVVGGVLGQEVVKALSQRDPPHNNFFFFDGIKGSGVVERLGPG
uniref:SUMO1 activating enzyme subunit 1 n=1 Tax=Gallus gallus TaxID=9031 RepID=A0A8V0Y0Y8_CHICK